MPPIPEKYTPICIVLDNKTNIMDFEIDPTYSKSMDYPKFSLGFQYYIHNTKEKTEALVKSFEGKKKVYLVTNPFERYIDDSKESIDISCKKYFKLDNKPNILSRGFFKLWEILYYFDLIDIKSDFVSAHLAEGPGSFIQATIFYRDLFSTKSKTDKYYAITLHPEQNFPSLGEDEAEDKKQMKEFEDKSSKIIKSKSDVQFKGGYVPPLEKAFIRYYDAEQPKRFVQYETVNKLTANKTEDRTNGDLLDPKTIKLFGGHISQKVDFITADGGLNWKNENTQEQEAVKLIFGEIVSAIKIQKKGGNFVIKFFETFTDMSVKLLLILMSFYDKVHLIKPLTSRMSNSEKYAVCMNFKFTDTDKKYKEYLKKLESVLDLSFKTDKNLANIFPEFIIENSFKAQIISLNLAIANKQFISINNMIKFWQSQDYHGDTYMLSRENQIDAARFWISTFLTPSLKKEVANDMVKQALKTIEVSIKKYDKLREIAHHIPE